MHSMHIHLIISLRLLKDIAKTIPKLNTENALAVEENYIKGVDRKKGNAALGML